MALIMKTNREIKSILIKAVRSDEQTALEQVLHAMCQNSQMHKVTIFENWDDADHIAGSYHAELGEDEVAELDELIESAKLNAFDAEYSFPALLPT
jgi:quinol monooxygenase YgiN